MEINADNIGKLKRALREDVMPLLSEDNLNDLLESADTLDEAIYNGAIMKSEDTTVQISGWSAADTSAYFLRLASLHRPNNTGVLKEG